MFLKRNYIRFTEADKQRIADGAVGAFNGKFKNEEDIDFDAPVGKSNFSVDVKFRVFFDCIDLEVEVLADVDSVVSYSIYPEGADPFEDGKVTVSGVRFYELMIYDISPLNDNYEFGGDVPHEELLAIDALISKQVLSF